MRCHVLVLEHFQGWSRQTWEGFQTHHNCSVLTLTLWAIHNLFSLSWNDSLSEKQNVCLPVKLFQNNYSTLIIYKTNYIYVTFHHWFLNLTAWIFMVMIRQFPILHLSPIYLIAHSFTMLQLFPCPICYQLLK